MQEYPMLAKTFKGLEDVLAQELTELGANNIHIERRAVSFSGDKALMYKANLCLRTASRILKPILTFRAKDADEVYETVKKIDWTQYMSIQTGFSIDSTVYSEEFRHSKYVTYRVKDAIADFFMEREGKRPSVKITQPDLYINVHISDTTVTISLDSSGESLHKRGYRVANTEAPINEALAAGMILMTGWKGETDFYDPMCGSGTLLIEAALIAQNIAPGIFRQNYAFCKWADFDADLWSDIYNDDSNERAFTHHIYGSDASFYAVQAALKNIKEAGMGRFIDVKQIRLQEIKREEQTSALVMMNPPYGERLAQDKDVLRLYADIGTALKHQFTGSTAWIISSNEEALKCIGLHPNKKVHLMNGELDCLFNCYELFSGERKEFVKTHPHRPQSERAPQAKSRRVAPRSHGQGSGTPRGGKGFARSRR
ncbi:MAG: RNA methyltransferase [Bacteroidales bacterium]|nr:RNA methyltransferase [Candidatus Colicola caccequi]